MSELDRVRVLTGSVNSVDPWPPSVPIPAPLAPAQRRKCGCKKKKKGGPLLMAGSAFLVGYGLAMLAAR